MTEHNAKRDCAGEAVLSSEREDLDVTNPAEYIEVALGYRLEEISALIKVAGGEADALEQEQVEGLDLGAEFKDEELMNAEDVVEAAERQILELPLSVEQTTTFEVVLGTGGPDDRLVFECDGGPELIGSTVPFEIRRAAYRYSWGSSAERRLFGDFQDAAEQFARWHIPDLT